MTQACIVVDVQNDFVEGGTLGVDGGHAAAARISSYLRAHRGDYDLVVSSQDWHHGDDDNGGHFAAAGTAPDFSSTWPRHCVAGTPGADLAPELDTGLIDARVRKGQGVPAYSAFEGQLDDGRRLSALLRERGVDHIDVVGIATDYCVLQTALDALRDGLRVRVLSDLVAGVAPDTSAAALDSLTDAGAEVVASEAEAN